MAPGRNDGTRPLFEPSPRRGTLGLAIGLYAFFLALGLLAWARGGGPSTLVGTAIILLVLTALWAAYALLRAFLRLGQASGEPPDRR